MQNLILIVRLRLEFFCVPLNIAAMEILKTLMNTGVDVEVFCNPPIR
jgi:hypothetical protein